MLPHYVKNNFTCHTGIIITSWSEEAKSLVTNSTVNAPENIQLSPVPEVQYNFGNNKFNQMFRAL